MSGNGQIDKKDNNVQNGASPQTLGSGPETSKLGTSGSEADEKNKEKEDLLYYYKLKNSDLQEGDLDKMCRNEVERICYTVGGSTEEIWGIHPLDCENEEGRRRVWKALMCWTHPDKHSGWSGEFREKAHQATQIVNSTKDAIVNPPNKTYPPSEDPARGTPEYTKFYNNVEVIGALISLMKNPDNEVAIKILTHTNSKIEKYNVEKNYPKVRGTFRMDKFRNFYRRAQKVYQELDKLSPGPSKERPKPSEEQAKELRDVFDRSKELCDDQGLPRSFSLPTSSYDFDPNWWWLKKYKETYNNEDGMMTTQEWREAKKASVENSPDEDDSMEDSFMEGGSTQESPKKAKFIPYQQANLENLTFDGYLMEAAIKIGTSGWLIFVKEREGYRLRSGAECGGPNYTKDIVDDLPRVGKGDKELLQRELVALKSGKKSSFVESPGMVQHAGGTWLLTKWKPDANRDTETRWVSRTTLAKCLRSSPMVDALIENHGGTLLAKGAQKLQWEAMVGMKTQQKLLCGAASASPDQTALVQALDLLRLSGRFKHPIYPFNMLSQV